jgi:hypothetical protein
VVKVRTTDKTTHVTRRRRFVVSLNGGPVTVGSGPDAALRVTDDPALAPVHFALVAAAPGSSAPWALMRPVARTYALIGQGTFSMGAQTLHAGAVLKLGACSLSVTDAALVPRFELVEEGTPAAAAAAAAAATTTAPLPAPSDAPLAPPASERRVPFVRAREAGAVCYVCYEGDSAEPLLHSPCACRTPVHRRCLSRWISTRGSRLCSICRGRLPIDFAVEPPFLVLSVVRHMRGLTWTGDREYILSFGGRAGDVAATLGCSPACDLPLPDPSLSRMHARIALRTGGAAATAPGGPRRFVLEDMGSSAGSFLGLPADGFPLRPARGGVHSVAMKSRHACATWSFKAGRSIVFVRVIYRGLAPAAAAALLAAEAAAGAPGAPLGSPPTTLALAATAAAASAAKTVAASAMQLQLDLDAGAGARDYERDRERDFERERGEEAGDADGTLAMRERVRVRVPSIPSPGLLEEAGSPVPLADATAAAPRDGAGDGDGDGKRDDRDGGKEGDASDAGGVSGREGGGRADWRGAVTRSGDRDGGDSGAGAGGAGATGAGAGSSAGGLVTTLVMAGLTPEERAAAVADAEAHIAAGMRRRSGLAHDGLL